MEIYKFYTSLYSDPNPNREINVEEINPPRLSSEQINEVEAEITLISLLPKIGKDTSELKNWRPITLSNCDFKLITKTLANRL